MSASSFPEGRQAAVDQLVAQAARLSMEIFVATTPGVGGANDSALEAMLSAMRKAAEQALMRFLDDAKHAPWIAKPAFAVAVLEIAEAGIKAWNALDPAKH